MRRALLSVAVALAGTAGVTASGWALQAAALPPPKPAARVAADASAWLHEYRFVIDIFHFDHRRTTGACLRGWFPGPGGSMSRASLLALESEPPQRVSARLHTLLAAGRRGRGLPVRILALVGCSGELSPILADAAQNGGRLTTERSYAANQPALALELERGKEARFTVYVSPVTYRPLVAFVDVMGTTATARLYLSPARPGLLHRFHLLRQENGKPKR